MGATLTLRSSKRFVSVVTKIEAEILVGFTTNHFWYKYGVSSKPGNGTGYGMYVIRNMIISSILG